MGTPNKYRVDFGNKAVEILSQGKSLAAVCAALDVSRQTLYEWRDTHPEFRDSLSIGIQKCQAYWEDIGMDGIVGNHEKFSASPWIFTMKNRFRDDYQEDKQEKTISVSIVEGLIDKLVE